MVMVLKAATSQCFPLRTKLAGKFMRRDEVKNARDSERKK